MIKSKSAIIDTFSIAGSNKHQAIYLQICDRIRRCVSQGLIKPGERIPSSRSLANELRISPEVRLIPPTIY